MWDLLHQTMHVIAQVGNDASAVASDALTTGVQAAPDAARAIDPAASAEALPGSDIAGTTADPSLTDAVPMSPEEMEAAQALLGAAQEGAVLQGAGDDIAVTQDMGMLGFIEQSDFVGKSLFVLLVVMSLLSWYLIFAKFFVNMSRRARTRKFLAQFWASGSLDDVERKWAVESDNEPFSRLTRHALNARRHHARYGGTNLEESGSTAAFVTRTMRKIIDEETARLENGLTVLASVGSTAPFVGLFGTVWGVYHALIGIGMSDGVTVNSIAGPVGEALIMTGLGLAVAIPAVLAYNGFVRSNRVYLARLDTFAHDLFSFLSTGQPVHNDPSSRTEQPDLRVASGGSK